MNLYRQQQSDQQARCSSFLNKYAFFAFDKDQFKGGLQKLGLTEADAGQLVRIPGGGYMLKEHAPAFKQMMQEFETERQTAMHDTNTGRQFTIDMFRTELNDHEYSYTGDPAEALEALGYTLEEIFDDPYLLETFKEAAREAG